MTAEELVHFIGKFFPGNCASMMEVGVCFWCMLVFLAKLEPL